jgi:hypothetical protein
MSVGGVRRGGKSGGPRGPSGPGKTGGTSTFKVGGTGATSGVAAKTAVAGAAGTDAADALAAIRSEISTIAAGLKNGTIASKAEATQKVVQMILEKKSLLGGAKGKGAKKLVQQIADTLQDDPRLAAALERSWSRASDS